MRRLTVPLVARPLRWLAVLAVAAAILVGSVVDVPGAVSSSTPWWDEIAHAVAYAAFASVLAYATVHWRDRPYRRAAVVVGVAVGYGALVELVQAPVPHRRFSPADAAVNAVGALLVTLWFVAERRVRYARASALAVALPATTLAVRGWL
ncbi:VanZ family protein [Salinirarus marinus]|uniref:VanZ family protein n=1 Tax=Salinirarus marinus TaxID=3068310 RepID=UPI003C6C5578